jgi:hypothetical protein
MWCEGVLATVSYQYIKTRDQTLVTIKNSSNIMSLIKFLTTISDEPILRNETLLEDFNTAYKDDLKKLRVLANSALEKLKEPTSVTSEFGILEIIGNLATLSEAAALVMDPKVRVVEIYARNRFFIDEYTAKNPFAFRGKILVIASQSLHVIDKVMINVSGLDPEPQDSPKAKNGEKPGDNGRNGKHGLPGYNSGDVCILAQDKFTNPNNLTFQAFGGRGQDGQNAGDGSDGVDGTDGVDGVGQDRGVLPRFSTWVMVCQ